MFGRRLAFLRIGLKGCQTHIWHASAQREVIKTLVAPVPEAKHLMHRVVEIASNPGGLYAVCLGLQIKQLPDSAAFPVKPAIKPWAAGSEWLLELGQHRHGEHTFGGDLLVTAYALGKFAAVAGRQRI